MRRLLARLGCRITGTHKIPDAFDFDRRWATCSACGELFDAAEQDRVETELQAFAP